MSDIAGEYIDRLVTVEMRNRGMNHGIISQIYNEARREGGGRPITARAAEALVEHVGEGDVVLIVTGAGYAPEVPNGESDGPPGAASIARALYWGLKAVPVYVSEVCHAPPVVASSDAAGVMIRDYGLAKSRRMGGAMVTAPEEQSEIDAWADDILDRMAPKAIIAIERLGPNESGIVHYSTGVAPGNCVNLSPLFDKAAERGILSIGIGDNGNEIGFGRIHSFMQDFHPYGRETQTDKPGGAVTVTPTDIFLPASVSNWGAYGVAAMLGVLLRDRDLVQTPQLEERIVKACLDAGGWEMRYCTSRFIVDGTEGESSMAIVQLLRDLVRLNIAAPDRGLSHGKMKSV
ncbi:glutamate cyclase domain-containing protein [Natronohydrobacter thiooxidans]|uniref:glutamate cyclase domain-containing protein n=1 Tax=Natronohydrobacter thiooxidans TaxID=87172 RepID=UPI0008FF5F5B|nr:glutamate cyclase domain-containing protein [Natronohydrobacter thiooxidans]